ncbi:hypothetical protein ZWY2020_056754 [Hordeum vulgare]|nr:hypothetical protein ZWY2020_056754 [Hordeum vulgare]
MAAPRLRRRLSQLCSGSASFPNRRSPRLDPPLSSAVVLLTVPAEPPLRPACIAVVLDGSPPPKATSTEAGLGGKGESPALRLAIVRGSLVDDMGK